MATRVGQDEETYMYLLGTLVACEENKYPNLFLNNNTGHYLGRLQAAITPPALYVETSEIGACFVCV